MKTFFIAAFGALIFLSGCSTVYRSGQTPDDIYYSSSPKVANARGTGDNSYVQANSSRNDGRNYDNQSTYSGYDDYATSDDRWLMMRVRDRARWSVFDDYNYYSPYNDFAYGGLGGYGLGYGYSPGLSLGLGFGSGFYSPYSFGLGLGYGGYGSFFNNYYNWNSFYNPYYSNMVVINPKLNPAGYTTMRNFNLGGYTNRNYSNSGSRTPSRPNYNGYVNPNSGSNRNRIYNNNRQNNNSGSNRNIYSNNSYLDRGNSRPVRSYTPSNNNSYTPRSSGISNGNSGGGARMSSGGGAGSRPSRR